MADYIDRDRFKIWLTEQVSKNLVSFTNAENCLSLLNYAPGANVAEVKHGHNLSNTPSYFVCSLCGDNCCDVYTYEPSQFNYCPNCGAKMDGGNDK